MNMNPNEIKKALECRVNCNSNECSECPYRMGEYLCDIVTSAKDALAYINQLEAEVERLKAESAMADGYAEALEERAKSEAIKEFAERVKANKDVLFNAMHSGFYFNVIIDNLVKEMVGDEK